MIGKRALGQPQFTDRTCSGMVLRRYFRRLRFYTASGEITRWLLSAKQTFTAARGRMPVCGPWRGLHRGEVAVARGLTSNKAQSKLEVRQRRISLGVWELARAPRGRKLIRTAIFFAFALSSSSARAEPINVVSAAPQLWGEVRYGMTPTEVRRIVSGSHPPFHADAAIDTKLQELLVADELVEGKSGLARFYFSDGRLIVVSMAATGADLDAVFVGRVVNDLSDKYGRAIENRSFILDSVSKIWPSRPTTVTMLFIAEIHSSLDVKVPGAVNHITINYFSSEYYRAHYHSE